MKENIDKTEEETLNDLKARSVELRKKHAATVSEIEKLNSKIRDTLDDTKDTAERKTKTQ